jgi:hypothetical protein
LLRTDGAFSGLVLFEVVLTNVLRKILIDLTILHDWPWLISCSATDRSK